jgi:hypothetical protein
MIRAEVHDDRRLGQREFNKNGGSGNEHRRGAAIADGRVSRRSR